MANFCPNCGQSVDSNTIYCPACGTSLNAQQPVYNQSYQQPVQPVNNTASTIGTVLGTLVAVNLVGGLTRQLYYYGGRYFLDPYCRQPFMGTSMILGGPRYIRPIHPPRPMAPRPMHMGAPRPPMGGGPRPAAGPRPMGGGPRPMGGGPKPGGGPRPGGGGPRGGHR